MALYSQIVLMCR